MANKTRWWSLAALVVALSSPGLALAQPTDPDAGKRAIELGKEAKAYYEQGRWADALEKFRQADGFVHSPVFTLYIARTERRVGKLIEARASFQRILGEELAKDAPEPWVAAHRDAKAELALVEPLIPHVTLSLVPPQSVQADVDGAPLRWSERVEINPGEHVVHVATTPPYEQKFSVAEGEDAKVSVTPPEPTPLDPKGNKLPKVETIVVPAQPGSLVPGGVVLGVGLAALVTGGIFSGIAFAARAAVKDLCPTAPACPAKVATEAMREDDRAGVFGNTSTGLFIGGGVAAAVGTILLVVRPGGTAATTKTVEVTVGPTWVGLSGSF